MVERPIKKSERQISSQGDVVEAAPETEPNLTEDSQVSVTQPLEERSSSRPLPRKDKTKEKTKSNQQESERSRQVNPALARGPKPTKPKLPVVKETTDAEDSVEDADGETTTED